MEILTQKIMIKITVENKITDATGALLDLLGIEDSYQSRKRVSKVITEFYIRGYVDRGVNEKKKRNKAEGKGKVKYVLIPPVSKEFAELYQQVEDRATVPTIEYKNWAIPELEDPKEFLLMDFLEEAIDNEGRIDVKTK